LAGGKKSSGAGNGGDDVGFDLRIANSECRIANEKKEQESREQENKKKEDVIVHFLFLVKK
jgi:hypothetical protein